MKLSLLKFQLALVFILAAIFAGAITMITWSQTPTFSFEVSMRSSTPGMAQTFYDVGQGIREKDSVRLQLHDPKATAVYRFPLPEAEYRAIRFDPLDHGNADLVIDYARIVDISGRIVRNFSLQDLTIEGGISGSEIKDGKIFLALGPTDNDSILVINPGAPFALHLTAATVWLFAARSFLFCFLPVVAAAGLWIIFGRRLWSTRAQERWSQISAAVHHHPHLALLVAAAIATIISCYPVVFCGRSFVSANNASLLYPNSPTVPGYQNTELEDFRNSDTGAMMWQNIPYSFVQHRSLARYGELPLWNRFHSSGTPLLGQGLSMFGDPLHMMVVAAGGSARAWDAKFLLAKFLFCWALGLLVFAAVRHLPTALLLAVSAAFLGLFSHRFDHPAFFSMCYAPWILYCWFRVKEATTNRSVVAWIIGLMVASWTELNSGTVKEAYMLILGMNGCGLLVVLLNDEPASPKFKKLIRLVFAGLLFIAISMPVWLTFLDALRIAFTVYSPSVWNIPPSLFIGIFDDIFYRQVTLGESVYTPSANFFVLLGFSLALAHSSSLFRDRAYRAVAISAVIAFAMAFSIVPPSLLVKIPFIGNIVHIGNTFSCVLIVYLFVLAGFGLRTFWQHLAGKEWKNGVAAAFVVMAVLLSLYFGFIQASSPDSPALWSRKISLSPFFDWYAPGLLIAVIALPFIARSISRHPAHRTITVPLLLAFLFLLHWRHGFHLKTGLAQIDDYVINPLVRAHFSRPSAAVNFVKAQPGIYRTVGFDGVLFPGYNALIGLESIYGTDPLGNPYYRQLLLAGGVKQDWSWRWIVEKTTLEANLPLYSLLNVRYFFSLPQEQSSSLPPLQQIGSFDLRVLKNEKAWPRAFFADRVLAYDTTEEFLQMIRKGTGSPLAAVQRSDTAALSATHEFQAGDGASHLVVPAKDFSLTSNNTTFVVDAPGPGVIVLTETYPDDEDFRATLNGTPTKYFRVNHAFRGVTVPAAGSYTISFSYWPKHFTLSLMMFGAGLVLLLGWLGTTLMLLPRQGRGRLLTENSRSGAGPGN